jgi:response regulator RpfG family c-di-GMP phosphodiesterase
MKARVLFVDDEPRVLSGLKRIAGRQYTVVTAQSGGAGLKLLLDEDPFAVVVSDMRMPRMDGAEFLSRVQTIAPEAVRMMLTGANEVGVATQAVNHGQIFRFLSKPCSSEDLLQALAAAVEQHRLITAERELLDRTLKGSVRVLSQVLSVVNPTAFGRASRVRRISQLTMEQMGEPMPWWLDVAAMLCQIGCVTVPEELLIRWHKGELLSEEEKAVIAEHPRVAAQMLSKIPRMQRVRQGILYQEKRYGGGGLPADSKREKDIPFAGRMIKLSLDFEMMIMKGSSPSQAMVSLDARAGWYDPDMLSALHRVVEQGQAHDKDELMIHQLEVGMIIDQDIYATGDMLLVAKETEITRPLLSKLDNWERLERVSSPIRVKIPKAGGGLF